MNKTKFYQKKWFAWVLLLLVPPVGIALLWIYKHHGKVLRSILSVVFGMIALGYYAGTDETEDVQTEIADEAEEIEEEPVQEEPTEEEIANQKAEEEEKRKKEEERLAEEKKKKEEEEKVTLSQKNAIGKAESYLNFTAFSKQGLIEQLEFDGFNKEDAMFAVDNIQVDWKEQAVKKAENYLDFTQFSRSGLIEQLEFDGFSNEDATYAVDTIGLY